MPAFSTKDKKAPVVSSAGPIQFLDCQAPKLEDSSIIGLQQHHHHHHWYSILGVVPADEMFHRCWVVKYRCPTCQKIFQLNFVDNILRQHGEMFVANLFYPMTDGNVYAMRYHDWYCKYWIINKLILCMPSGMSQSFSNIAGCDITAQSRSFASSIRIRALWHWLSPTVHAITGHNEITATNWSTVRSIAGRQIHTSLTHTAAATTRAGSLHHHHYRHRHHHHHHRHHHHWLYSTNIMVQQ